MSEEVGGGQGKGVLGVMKILYGPLRVYWQVPTNGMDVTSFFLFHEYQLNKSNHISQTASSGDHDGVLT